MNHSNNPSQNTAPCTNRNALSPPLRLAQQSRSWNGSPSIRENEPPETTEPTVRRVGPHEAAYVASTVSSSMPLSLNSIINANLNRARQNLVQHQQNLNQSAPRNNRASVTDILDRALSIGTEGPDDCPSARRRTRPPSDSMNNNNALQ